MTDHPEIENEQSRNSSVSSGAEQLRQINKRPLSVTLLALIVLIITVINLFRLVLSIRYWNFLSSRSGISPLYLAITGLIWSVAGVALLWGLWKATAWTPKLMQALGLTFSLYYWLDHIFLMGQPTSGAVKAFRAILPINWQFAFAVTAIGLGFMEWTLSRKKVKAYFTVVDHEPTQIQSSDLDQG